MSLFSKCFFKTLCGLILCASLGGAKERPNIILILADDMGYSDLGSFGGEIETPHLDRLAYNGVRFTHFYNTSRCCPTRASILTGLYQHQVGYGSMDSDLGYPSYQGRFRDGIVTVAQLLQNADYQTMMLGKWHLGHEKEHYPLARGFDQMYGIPKGGGVYFYPCVGRDRQVYLNDELMEPDETWYSTDAFTDYGIRFAEEAIKEDRPFFMYLAYIAPHFPLQAWPEDIAKYHGRYSKGYQYYRNQRFQKQKELGILSPDTILSPPEYSDWEEIEDKDEEDLKMAIYAAQVDRMDQNIGRLVTFLDDRGALDNSVIFFLSDNGAVNVELNDFPDAELGSRDSWAAYGKSWGNVSNTPYRKYKAMTHEGGIISPLIVHWPEGLRNSGTINHEPAHIVDVVPTLLSLAQIDYPERYNEHRLASLVGEDLLPLIQGGKQGLDRTFFFEHNGNRAIRAGNLKAVQLHKKAWELYNLVQDPTELNDLAVSQSADLQRLQSLYRQWARDYGVLPWPVKR